VRFADIDGIGGHHSLSCSLRGIIYLKSRLIFILRPQNQINVAMSKDVTMRAHTCGGYDSVDRIPSLPFCFFLSKRVIVLSNKLLAVRNKSYLTNHIRKYRSKQY
jgi:hypothetical protein